MAGSAEWVDILPNMAKFGATLTKGAAASARVAGVKAGTEFAAGTAKGGAAGAEALVKELTTASRRAEGIVKAQAAAIAAARARESDATAAAIKAEANLAAARAKSGASSAEAQAAEAKLSAAMQRQASVAIKSGAALDTLKYAQAEAKVTATQLSVAQTDLAAANARATTKAAIFGKAVRGGGEGIASMAEKAKGAVGSIGGLVGLFGAFELVEFGKKSLEEAQDYQKSTNVLVTAAGENTKNIASIRAGLLKISSDTGTSLDQMTEGMYTVEKAGYRGAKGLTIMQTAAKGARDEGADLGVITNGLTSIMNAYGSTLSSPEKAMNALMVAAGHSKSTLQDFTNSLSNVLPVASKLGIPFNQITGALGTMTSTGMSAQQASQDLNHVISSLAAPTTVMAQEMGAFGISAEDVRDKLSKRGLQGTLNLLSDTVQKKLGPATAEAARVIKTLPSSYQDLWAQFTNGTITLKTFERRIQSAKTLTDGQKKSVMDSIPAARGYSQAIEHMTGGILGLNVSMMLTGSASKGLAERTSDVGKAMNSTEDFNKKWNMTSKTTAVQMAIAKQTISNVGVSIATDLLPGLANMARGFAIGINQTVAFVRANKSWLFPLLGGIAAVVVAWKAMGVVTAAYNAVLGIARGGILIYTGLTKGLTLAQILQASATGEATGAMIGLDAAMDANPIGLLVLAIMAAIAIIAALVVGVIYAYNHFAWFRDTVNAVGNAVKVAFSAIGVAAVWLWQAVIVPAFNAMIGVARWFGDTFAAIFKLAWTLIKIVFGPAVMWLWNSIIKPVFGWIGGLVSNWWNHVVKPPLDAFIGFMQKNMPGAIQIAKDAIGKIWGGIKEIFAAPIRFVVNTVLDDGIIGNFNKVASALEGKGAKLIPRVSLPKGFAGGGVLSGYQSARRDDRLVPMRSGEGVLVPEVVRALGPQFVHALNAAGNTGGVAGVRRAAGFASGGIVGSIGGAISGAWDWTKNAAATAKDIVTDPAGTLGKVVNALIGKIPGGGSSLALAAGMGHKVLDSGISALKGLAGKVFGSEPISGLNAAVGDIPKGVGVAQWSGDVVKALAANGLSTSQDMVAKVLRQIATESGGNPKAVQHGYTDVNTLSGDLAKGLMQTISATFNAYKFPGHGDIFNGYDNMLAALNYAKHRYGPNLNGLGEGHGYAEGGIVPTLLDEGGLLAPGVSVVANNTKKPEYALPEPRLQQIVREATGPSKVVHNEPHFHNEGRDFTEADYISAQHKIDVLSGTR